MTTLLFSLPSTTIPASGASATLPTGQADHVAAALSRLYRRHRQPKIEELITIFAERYQALELVCWDLLTKRTIYTAAGIYLDRIGVKVGQARGGLSDDDYRRYLFARIATNRSQGVTTDLIKIARLILNDATMVVQVVTDGEPGITVTIPDAAVDDTLANILVAFLLAAKSAGVPIALETQYADDDLTFSCSLATATTAPIAIGDTTITVASTAGFPSVGTLLVQDGEVPDIAELIDYTGITPTAFLGCDPLEAVHASGVPAELAYGPGVGFSEFVTSTTAALVAGDTTIPVADTTGFAASGSITIDSGILVTGLVREETVTYSGKTLTSFTGVSPLVYNHPDTGIDVVSSADGGLLASARSAAYTREDA
jgi:hypothetical protein